MSGTIQRLRAQNRADAESLARQVDRLRAASHDADPGTAAQIAWALHHAYTAIEAILERTARVVEGGLPSGPDWHAELLSSAGLELAGIRPAILSPGVVAVLHELRRFRHFARHGYGMDFDWSRLETNRTAILAHHAALVADLLAFDDWLSAVVNASEAS